MDTAQFGFMLDYDTGRDPSVAANEHGLTVEVHSAWERDRLFYHFGLVRQMSMEWCPSVYYTDGRFPGCSVNKDGVVVEVHQSASQNTVWYMVGELWALDADGGTPAHDVTGFVTGAAVNDYCRDGEKIHWGTSTYYDTGITPDVAVNDLLQVVEVHHTHRESNTELFFRVGRVNPGRYEIEWGDSHEFADGDFPKVDIDDNGSVVIVWSERGRVRYRVARIRGNELDLDLYEAHDVDDGERADVALSQNGKVVLSWVGSDETVYQRVGRLGPASIAWEDDASALAWVVEACTVTMLGNYALAVSGQPNGKLAYSAALVLDHARWMETFRPRLGPFPLRRITVAGSHDASMYAGGLGGRTQDLSYYGQLGYGVRWFDVRIQYTRDDENKFRFFTHHKFVLGPLLDDVLADLKRFAEEGHREFAILTFDLDTGFNADVYKKFVAKVREAIGRWLYDAAPPPGKRFADLTLGELLGPEMRYFLAVRDVYARDDPQPGFWYYRKADDPYVAAASLRVYNVFAETTSWTEMRDDQFAKYRAYNGYCTSDPTVPCDLYLLSWTVTPFTGVWWWAQVADEHLGECMPTLPNDPHRPVNIVYCDYVEWARATDVALMMNGVGVW
jgi:hypothetical protein